MLRIFNKSPKYYMREEEFEEFKRGYAKATNEKSNNKDILYTSRKEYEEQERHSIGREEFNRGDKTPRLVKKMSHSSSLKSSAPSDPDLVINFEEQGVYGVEGYDLICKEGSRHYYAKSKEVYKPCNLPIDEELKSEIVDKLNLIGAKWLAKAVSKKQNLSVQNFVDFTAMFSDYGFGSGQRITFEVLDDFKKVVKRGKLRLT